MLLHNIVSLREAQHRWALAHIVDAKHHIVFEEVKTSFLRSTTSFCVRKRNDVDLRSNDVCGFTAKRCCALADINTKNKGLSK